MGLKEEWRFSLLFRWRGTVVTQIWWKVILLTIHTIVIVCLQNYMDNFFVNFPMTLLSVLGIVTGMLLVFRTNTAYDRYWEGRRLWSQLNQHSRNLARNIWLGVDDEEPTSIVEETVEEQEKIDKPIALNLVTAFAFATKNYLRGQYSRESPDLVDLLGYHLLAGDCSCIVNDERDNGVQKLVKNQTKKRTKVTEEECIEIDLRNEDCVDFNLPPVPRELTAHDFMPPTNIPVQISAILFKFVKQVNAKKLADGPTVSAMYGAISSLIECLTGFERIQRTPMPKAYNVHLHQIVWIYLLLLPIQYVYTLGWWTVGAVAVAAFAFLGILTLGWEIEKPFGTDHNDLPLDDFCNVIREEVQQLMVVNNLSLLNRATVPVKTELGDSQRGSSWVKRASTL